jgi:hypothetical protein
LTSASEIFFFIVKRFLDFSEKLYHVAGGIPLSPDSEGEESEEESEVLEESPCGRWRKMRAEVRFPRNGLSLIKVGV